MNVLDLFSGIGGFSLGLERAGMHTVGFCEIDPHCQRVLAKHWPDTPCHDDIQTFTPPATQQNLFAADTHANHFHQQEDERAKKMKGISGLRCLELYAVSGRDGLLPKMLLDILASVSTKLPHRWKMKASRSGRLLFQLVPLMPRIGGIDCGLWRTPDASIVSGGAANAEDRKAQGHAVGLHDQVNTPSMWPTPTAQDAKNNGAPSQANRNIPPLNSVAGGSLNPEWVEWLMGYPIGWTDLKNSGTPSSRKSRKSSATQ